MWVYTFLESKEKEKVEKSEIKIDRVESSFPSKNSYLFVLVSSLVSSLVLSINLGF